MRQLTFGIINLTQINFYVLRFKFSVGLEEKIPKNASTM